MGELRHDVGDILSAGLGCCRDGLTPKLCEALALLRRSPAADTDADVAAAAALLVEAVNDAFAVNLALTNAAAAYRAALL